MKNLLACILFGLCFSLPSCINIEPERTTRPEPCEQLGARIGIERGLASVRNLTVWVPERPATAEEISEGLVEMEALQLWLLVTEDSRLYEACNLPEDFRKEQLEVFFDAHLLDASYNNPRVEGIIPISLIEIEEEPE